MIGASDFSAWASAIAALVSALFAGIAWYSWRAQFRLSFPYIETSYELLANAHLIHWSMGGQSAGDWSLEWVRIKGGSAKLAQFRTLARPNNGRSNVGGLSDFTLQQRSPRSPLVIVDQTDPLEITLTFLLRSKANQSLRKKVKRRISLAEISAHTNSKPSGLFSGEVEVRF